MTNNKRAFERALFSLPPWQSIGILEEIRLKLKQDAPLPDSVVKIATYTAAYEAFIRDLWDKVKQDPTRQNILDFIDVMVTASDEVWEEFYLDLLDLEELLPIHRAQFNKDLEQHKWYLQNSLLPDLLKEVGKGSDAFNSLDHRVIFMYAGAMWAAGNIATVLFDGLEFRDLADIFLFSGPNDSETCTGDRGCDQYAGKLLTVAQIIAGDIIPGHLQCYTNCRHVLIPILSPLNKVATKGSNLSGNWGHIGRPGKVGGSMAGSGLRAIGAVGTTDVTQRRLRAQMLKDTRKLLEDDLKAAAEQLGYDPKNIKFMGQGYQFEVAGTQFTAGADFNMTTGIIRVYSGSIVEEGATFKVSRGVLAHEIQHSRWNNFQKASEEQSEAINARLREESAKGVHYRDSFMKPTGEFRSETDRANYKLLTTRRELLENRDTIQQFGGITPYSRKYWDKYAQTHNTRDYYRAVDETLAEVAKYKVLVGGSSVIPAYWNSLYAEINELADEYQTE